MDIAKLIGVDPAPRLKAERLETQREKHYPVLISRNIPYSADEICRVKPTIIHTMVKKVG